MVGPGSRCHITLPSQPTRKEASLKTFFSCLFLLEVRRLTPEHILRIISRQNVLGAPHVSPGTLSCFLKFSSTPCARPQPCARRGWGHADQAPNVGLGTVIGWTPELFLTRPQIIPCCSPYALKSIFTPSISLDLCRTFCNRGRCV